MSKYKGAERHMPQKIMITGQNGYVARNLDRFLSECGFETNLVNVRDSSWEAMDFSVYDVIIHPAALLHGEGKGKSREEFEKINITLTKALAIKAKSEGVGHFIFFSTMHVYGMEDLKNRLCAQNVITSETLCNPKNMYSKSKLIAEQALEKLSSSDFIVLSLRCPMIYGKQCPGNYGALRKLALKIRVVPDIFNQRSLLHIDNLCSFVVKSIENKLSGIGHPQDREYVCTANMLELIANINNVHILRSKLLGLCARPASVFLTPLRKAFGNLTIDASFSDPGFDYHVGNFKECMKRTEPWP